MARRQDQTLTIENDGGEEIEIPSRFEVCPTCEGRGQHSRRFGAIAMEDFMGPDWDDDSRDDYLSGRYDERCEECQGKRVVSVADRARCTPEQIKLIDADFESRCEMRAIEEAERRFGC